MTDIASPPSFSSAPSDYSQRYFNQLLDDLRRIVVQLNNPGPVVCSSLRFLQLPTTGAMLPGGSVFIDGDTLKIVDPDVPYAPTMLAMTAVGSVTVTVA